MGGDGVYLEEQRVTRQDGRDDQSRLGEYDQEQDGVKPRAQSGGVLVESFGVQVDYSLNQVDHVQDELPELIHSWLRGEVFKAFLIARLATGGGASHCEYWLRHRPPGH